METDLADPDPPAVPFALKVVAAVWVGYSLVWWFVGSVAVVALAVVVPVGRVAGWAICLTLPGVYSASILWAAGLRVFGRSPQSVRRAARMSLAAGFVHLGLAAMLFIQGHGVPQRTLFALVATLWTPGALLIAAGVIALHVRQDEPRP